MAVWDDALGGFNTVWSAKSHTETAQDTNVHPVVNTLTTASDAIGLTQLAGTAVPAVVNKLSPGLIPKCPQTPIIQAGLLAIAAMTLECGIGTPDSGDRFGKGKQELNTAAKILESAIPTQAWQGDAARAYTARGTKQQERCRLIATADSIIETTVQKQASQVTNTRKVLDACSVALGIMVAPAMAAYPFLPAGPAISMQIQIGAVAGTVPPALAALTKLSLDASTNMREIAKATQLYSEVAATARA
ncbi:EspA/EspE family type VII secretion system effector [Mycolicibacterium sp. HK-90]|uniref:EspA/EspE family type VII secretion system effector n=1 Tax=Mycolicibacterium sp. HK-90 TaxID=3056937 RepID=UPI0026595E01|nr:EspA/EspE family type VII secretion system effector [Mycolicibacterium sp. HK-90]WKG04256.1 EspA/EspE family type VII secretion system effector [Mycolicibacterium sp. HK-90]